jgi:hypothetical protein
MLGMWAMDLSHQMTPERRDSSNGHGVWRFTRSSKLLQPGQDQNEELIRPGSFMGMELVVLFSGDALPMRESIETASASSTNYVPEGDPDRRP